jgi:hypothetical protein
MTTTPATGTLIHGTHAEWLLIPAFFDELREHAPVAAANIVNDFGQGFIDRCSTMDGLDYSLVNEMDNRGWLMEALYDALDDIAPEGCYFGAHPGDGADFGFWEADDEDY